MQVADVVPPQVFGLLKEALEQYLREEGNPSQAWSKLVQVALQNDVAEADLERFAVLEAPTVPAASIRAFIQSVKEMTNPNLALARQRQPQPQLQPQANLQLVKADTSPSLEKRLQKILRVYGVEPNHDPNLPQLVRAIEPPILGPRFEVYRLQADKVQTILKERENLIHCAHLPKNFVMVQEPGYVELQVPRATWDVQEFRLHVMERDSTPTSPFAMPVGLSLEGKPREGILECGLIGGRRRSGKSSQIRSMVTACHWWYSPEHLQVILLDNPVKQEFNLLDGSGWLLGDRTYSKPTEIISVLRWLNEEVRRRCNEFQLARQGGKAVYTLEDYNANFPIPLPRLVLFFEEVTNTYNYAGEKLAHKMNAGLQALAQLSGAAGIQIFLSTQRFAADWVDVGIRGNINSDCMAFQCSENDSQIILGDKSKDGAIGAQLEGKGDFVWRHGPHQERLQAYYVCDASIRRVIANRSKKYEGFLSRKPIFELPPYLDDELEGEGESEGGSWEASPPKQPSAPVDYIFGAAPIVATPVTAMKDLDSVLGFNDGKMAEFCEQRYRLLKQANHDFLTGKIKHRSALVIKVWGDLYADPKTAANGRYLDENSKRSQKLIEMFEG